MDDARCTTDDVRLAAGNLLDAAASFVVEDAICKFFLVRIDFAEAKSEFAQANMQLR